MHHEKAGLRKRTGVWVVPFLLEVIPVDLGLKKGSISRRQREKGKPLVEGTGEMNWMVVSNIQSRHRLERNPEEETKEEWMGGQIKCD